LAKRRRELYSSVRSINPAKISDYFRETQALIQDEAEDRLKKILLPHQYKRLAELQVKMKMRSQGVGALAGTDMADLLGLSDDQREKLAKKQREAAAELQKKVDEIRKQLQDDILSDVLTSDQRKKLEGLIGSAYNVKPRQNPLLNLRRGAPAKGEPSRPSAKTSKSSK